MVQLEAMGFDGTKARALLAGLPALPDLETAMDMLLAQNEAEQQEQIERAVRQEHAAQAAQAQALVGDVLTAQSEEFAALLAANAGAELQDDPSEDRHTLKAKRRSRILHTLAEGDAFATAQFVEHCALRASFPSRRLNLVGWEEVPDTEDALGALCSLLSSPNMSQLEELVLSLPRWQDDSVAGALTCLSRRSLRRLRLGTMLDRAPAIANVLHQVTRPWEEPSRQFFFCDCFKYFPPFEIYGLSRS